MRDKSLPPSDRTKTVHQNKSFNIEGNNDSDNKKRAIQDNSNARRNFAPSGSDVQQPSKLLPPPEPPPLPPRHPRTGTAMKNCVWQQRVTHKAIKNRGNVQHDTIDARKFAHQNQTLISCRIHYRLPNLRHCHYANQDGTHTPSSTRPSGPGAVLELLTLGWNRRTNSF